MVDKTYSSADFQDLFAEARALPEVYIEPGRHIWIFGAGNFGRSLASVMQAQGIDVKGFVETTPHVPSVLGLPVVNWDELAREHPQAQLALGIFNRDTPYDELLDLVARAGFAPPLMPWAIYEQFSQALGWRFWLSARSFLLDAKDRIASVAEALTDIESRKILYRMCAFRLGLDMQYSSFLSNETRYINELTLPALQGRDITYVDCGAYDGDSYEELIDEPEISCKQAPEFIE